MTGNNTRDKNRIRAITLSTGLIVIGFTMTDSDEWSPQGTLLLEPLFVSVDQNSGMVQFAEITPLAVEPLSSLRIKAEQALGHAYRIQSELENIFLQALESRDNKIPTLEERIASNDEGGMFVKG